MMEKWSCADCGEKVSNSYVECWNCQSARPGYSTAAEQVKRYDEQHAEWLRQNDLAVELQEEHVRQCRLAKELLKLDISNQARLSSLLDRWEKLTDQFELNSGVKAG